MLIALRGDGQREWSELGSRDIDYMAQGARARERERTSQEGQLGKLFGQGCGAGQDSPGSVGTERASTSGVYNDRVIHEVVLRYESSVSVREPVRAGKKVAPLPFFACVK